MRSLKVLSMGSSQLASLVRDALRLHGNSRVCTVTSYRDLCSLAMQQQQEFQVTVLGGSFSAVELQRSAECIRRRWPLTAILLIADTPAGLDDPLYDRRVPSSIRPEDLVKVIERIHRGEAMSEHSSPQFSDPRLGGRHVR
jgi:hypothetical protein